MILWVYISGSLIILMQCTYIQFIKFYDKKTHENLNPMKINTHTIGNLCDTSIMMLTPPNDRN